MTNVLTSNGPHVDLGNAIACARCGKPITLKHRGRPQRYCSDACRQQAFRKQFRDSDPYQPPEDPKNGNFVTKLVSENNDLQGSKNDLRKANLSWRKINEITWKLTNGEMIRTPASHGQWPGYNSELALAWAINTGWLNGGETWYARCGDKSFGPATIIKAKAAAVALVTGYFPASCTYVSHDKINLDLVALVAPAPAESAQ